MKKQRLPHEPLRVEDFIATLQGDALRWTEDLHHDLLAFDHFRCAIRWSIPFYGIHSWQVYLNPQKESGVECCFMRGEALMAGCSILHRRNRSMVAGLRFPEESTDIHCLNDVIHESILKELDF